MKHIALAVATAVVLAGCSAGPTSTRTPVRSDRAACQQVADFINAGQPRDARRVVREAADYASDPDLKHQLLTVEIGANNTKVWDLRINAIAQRCLDLGKEQGWLK